MVYHTYYEQIKCSTGNGRYYFLDCRDNYKCLYSRRHKNIDVTVPFHRNRMRALPFAILSPAHNWCISVLFCSGSAAHTSNQYTTPMPVDRGLKKNLVESEITFASVIKMQLFEYLPSYLSLETAPCN